MLQFSKNPMLSATEDSYPKALRISTYHDHALEAEKDKADILALYTPYHQKHLALKAAIDDWEKQGGQQMGTTLNLNQLMKLLGSTKIGNWQAKVVIKYAKNTPGYRTIFPNGTEPFHSGTQLEKVQAVDLLDQKLANFTDLADLKTDVTAFNTMLKAAFNTQKLDINTTKGKSEIVEAARVDMCIAQYSDLGDLMKQNAANPERILKYFDMTVLANSTQVTFMGHVNAGEAYTIVKHTFVSDDQISLSNTGTTTLRFYLAAERNTDPGTLFITLEHGKEIVLASALGNLDNAFLTVFNPDTNKQGTFEVEIL